jgi:hypothetical protein
MNLVDVFLAAAKLSAAAISHFADPPQFPPMQVG